MSDSYQNVMNVAIRESVVRTARSKMSREWPDINPAAACLQTTISMIAIGNLWGMRLLLQAGSAYWPSEGGRRDPLLWGYEWEGIESPNVQSRLRAGLLPEIHVWAYDQQTHDIVDLTTGYQPQQAKNIANMDWSAKMPPDYWWGPATRMPKHWEYRVDQEASDVAYQLAKKLYRWE